MGFDLSILGVEKNIPKVAFTEYSGVFEAPEKFGKTAMSALYPNSILLAFEKGYSAQAINKVDINKWKDVIDFIKKLKKHRKEIGDSIQTIVFDTADEAYPLVETYMCQQEGANDSKVYNNKTDIPFGQGWALHDKYFKDAIREIHNLGFTILYLTHSQIKTIKPKNSEEYQIHKSTMSDRLAQIVYAEVDYILHGERVKIEENGKQVMKRALVVKGNDESIAGNRVYFDEDIVFDSEEEAMEKFQTKFEEGIKKNLAKAGIKTDFNKLKKTQKEQREKDVEKYIEENEDVLIDKALNKEMLAEISKLFVSANPEKKASAKELVGKYGLKGFKDTNFPTADIEEILNVLK